MGRLSEIYLDLSSLPGPEPERTDIQDIGHAGVIALLAEGAAVALFIAMLAVWAAIGSGA